MGEATRSICPVCFKTIPAERVRRENRIYLCKECDEHGRFEALLWDERPTASPEGGLGEAISWDEWKIDGVNTPPVSFETAASHGCPHDCGLCENHLQQACCVLIEVTQRCDQNCRYCFASAGPAAGSGEDLTIDEIRAIYEDLLAKSPKRPFNIQLSGGEPTIRDDLPEIIRLGRDTGFPYIQLNTNGKRLAEEPGYAASLRDAGLSSVFLQFDGTEDAVYEKIRGKALLKLKEQAIDSCAAAGLGTVLVVTVVPGVNDHDLGALLDFAIDRLPYVRGIHFQPVSYFGRYPSEPEDHDRITIPELLAKLADQSGGRLAASQFVPLQTGHTMCSFHGNFVIMEDGSMISISADPKKGDCSCRQRSIENARNYIAKKWSYEDKKTGTSTGGNYDFSSWDLFLERAHTHGFSITAMAFQDAWNLDLERLRKCRVHIALKDGRLMPFCAYNIIHRYGKPERDLSPGEQDQRGNGI